jgi:hypothetical protein
MIPSKLPVLALASPACIVFSIHWYNRDIYKKYGTAMIPVAMMDISNGTIMQSALPVVLYWMSPSISHCLPTFCKPPQMPLAWI